MVEGLAKKRGERFAFDCYRRLLDMFGDVVLGIEHEKFEEHIHAVKVGRVAASCVGVLARKGLLVDLRTQIWA